MATKRKAPKGCYWRGPVLWGRIKVAGQEIRFSLRTDDAVLAAARLKERRDREIAASHFGDARATWDDALIAWGSAITAHAKPSTVARYACSLDQLKPYLANLYVDEIDKKVVNDLVRRRRVNRVKGKETIVSNATIRRDLTALSSVLIHAEQEGWIEGNPALWKLQTMKERRDPIVLPELDHIRMVIDRAPGNFGKLIEAALLTGCRLDELRQLERRHLDFSRGQVTLYRTKNGRPRVIDMRDSFELFQSLPLAMTSQYVFHYDGGRPYLNVSSNFRRVVAATKAADEVARKRAQRKGEPFRPFRFHDLRHRFAVDALKNGMSIYDLQQHLGHSSVQVTELYLAYLTADEADRAKRSAAQNTAQVHRFGREAADANGMK